MIAQIDINYELCKDPLNCRKCMSLCPSVVFVCGPTKVWKGRETDPSDYKLVARYYDKCNGCGDCESACPTGALSLNWVSKEELAERFKKERSAQLKEKNA